MVVSPVLLRDPLGKLELVELLGVTEADRERVDRMVDESLIRATLVEESTPPDKKTPTGTCSSSGGRSIVRDGIQVPRPSRCRPSRTGHDPGSGPVAHRRARTPAVTTIVCAGASLLTPENNVRGGGPAQTQVVRDATGSISRRRVSGSLVLINEVNANRFPSSKKYNGLMPIRSRAKQQLYAAFVPDQERERLDGRSRLQLPMLGI